MMLGTSSLAVIAFIAFSAAFNLTFAWMVFMRLSELDKIIIFLLKETGDMKENIHYSRKELKEHKESPCAHWIATSTGEFLEKQSIEEMK